MTDPVIWSASGSTRRVFGAAAVCIVSAVAVRTGEATAEPAPQTYVVTIDQMRFDPPQLTVHMGDRVLWRNKDLVAHTASADAKAFDSQEIVPDGTWRFVARHRGHFPYHCTLHPVMRGELIVQ
jgi:plastocyanin